MDISIVIPLLNESESLAKLHYWILQSLKKEKYSYEIIFIDDGSSDSSWEIVKDLSQKHANTHGIKCSKKLRLIQN